MSPPASPTIAPHLAPYQTPLAKTLLLPGDTTPLPITRLVAAAAVVCSKRILLLQRSANSFQPLLWELPGGRCELHDDHIIASACRELREESGLVARAVVDVVGTYEWLDRGEVWKKVTFLVDVDVDVGEGEEGEKWPGVVLDPEEHGGFVWASREDVGGGDGGGGLEWTSEEQRGMVLRAFERVDRVGS